MGDGLALLTCIPEMMRAMSDIPTDLPESTPPPPQRCAVYTRVSMDNAEDDKLSSVQAQFMACHELIASQFGKHWVPTDRIYEDRGYSGSNIRRPGLQELLSDVADGLVDIVVVHRLDRLSPQSAMTRRNPHKHAIADKKTNWRTSWFFNLVELAGIEPASTSHFRTVLHV